MAKTPPATPPVKRPKQYGNLVKKGVPPRVAKKIAGKKG